MRPCLIFLRFKPIFRKAFLSQQAGFDGLQRLVENRHEGAANAVNVDRLQQAHVAIFVDDGFGGLFYDLSSLFRSAQEWWVSVKRSSVGRSSSCCTF
jgi:hypothetical protein